MIYNVANNPVRVLIWIWKMNMQNLYELFQWSADNMELECPRIILKCINAHSRDECYASTFLSQYFSVINDFENDTLTEKLLSLLKPDVTKGIIRKAGERKSDLIAGNIR